MRVWLVGLCGCGSAVVPFDDEIPGIDWGSGPGAGAYEVVAHVHTDAKGVTEAAVSVVDRGGDPVDAEVEVNGHPLDGEDGAYLGAWDGYDRHVHLTVDGPKGKFRAAALGPEPHVLEAPVGPWVRGEPVTVDWDPAGATFAAIEGSGPGRTDLDEDAGTYTFDPGTLNLYAITVTVERWETLPLTGGRGDSSLTVATSASLNRTVVDE